MKQWHKVLRQVLKYGEVREDRTGVGTRSVFGTHSRFDLRDGFPAVTTKKLYFGQVAAELAAFIAGAETLEEFHKFGCNIWNANALAYHGRFPGDLGRIYGVNWRRWRSWVDGEITPELKETDQLRELIENLRGNPFSRRHVVTAWNPGELDQMCLPPCHTFFQCYVSKDGFLDLRFDLRSVDLFIGYPFDVASYALLAHLLARSTGLTARQLYISMGDAHIYNNHLEQVEEVLSRKPMQPAMLCLTGDIDALNFHPSCASLAEYVSHPPVRATMNV